MASTMPSRSRPHEQAFGGGDGPGEAIAEDAFPAPCPGLLPLAGSDTGLFLQEAASPPSSSGAGGSGSRWSGTDSAYRRGRKSGTQSSKATGQPTHEGRNIAWGGSGESGGDGGSEGDSTSRSDNRQLDAVSTRSGDGGLPKLRRNKWINRQVTRVANSGNLQRLLQTIQYHISEMNAINLVTALHRVTKLAVSCPDSAASVEKLLKHPSFRQLSSTVVQRIEAGLSPEVAGSAPPFEVQCMSIVCWSCATLRLQEERLMSAIAGIALERLGELKPFELSNMVWAYAKLAMGSPQLFQGVSQRMLHRGFGEFSLQCLSMVAWSFATAKHKDPGLFSNLASEIVQCAGSAKPQEIANTLWAYAKSRCAESSLFKALGDAALQHNLLWTFKPQELSNTLWAFATIGQQHPMLFRRAVSVALNKRREMSPQNSANILWAYAKLQVCRRSGLFPALFMLLSSSVPIGSKHKPQEMSAILWAAAREGFLGARPEDAQPSRGAAAAQAAGGWGEGGGASSDEAAWAQEVPDEALEALAEMCLETPGFFDLSRRDGQGLGHFEPTGLANLLRGMVFVLRRTLRYEEDALTGEALSVDFDDATNPGAQRRQKQALGVLCSQLLLRFDSLRPREIVHLQQSMAALGPGSALRNSGVPALPELLTAIDVRGPPSAAGRRVAAAAAVGRKGGKEGQRDGRGQFAPHLHAPQPAMYAGFGHLPVPPGIDTVGGQPSAPPGFDEVAALGALQAWSSQPEGEIDEPLLTRSRWTQAPAHLNVGGGNDSDVLASPFEDHGDHSDGEGCALRVVSDILALDGDSLGGDSAEAASAIASSSEWPPNSVGAPLDASALWGYPAAYTQHWGPWGHAPSYDAWTAPAFLHRPPMWASAALPGDATGWAPAPAPIARGRHAGHMLDVFGDEGNDGLAMPESLEMGSGGAERNFWEPRTIDASCLLQSETSPGWEGGEAWRSVDLREHMDVSVIGAGDSVVRLRYGVFDERVVVKRVMADADAIRCPLAVAGARNVLVPCARITVAGSANPLDCYLAYRHLGPTLEERLQMGALTESETATVLLGALRAARALADSGLELSALNTEEIFIDAVDGQACVRLRFRQVDGVIAQGRDAKWLAPEEAAGKPSGWPSIAFRLGLLMYCIGARAADPYPLKRGDLVRRDLKREAFGAAAVRPDMSLYYGGDRCRELMERCLATRGTDRPSASKLETALEEMLGVQISSA